MKKKDNYKIKKTFGKYLNYQINEKILIGIMTLLTLSIFIIDLSIVDYASITSDGKIAQILELIVKTTNGYNIIYIPMFVAIYYFYSKNYFDGTKKNVWIMIISAFISFMTIIGISYYKYRSWDIIFLDWYHFTKSMIVIFGYYFAFYICIKKAFQYSDKYKPKISTNKIMNFVFEKHPFIISFLLIILCWIPYMICYYPGTTPGTDTIRQLYEFYNIIGPTGHPYAHTFILGCFCRFGSLIGSRNIGMFSYVIIQSIILASIFAYTIVLMKKYKTPLFIRIISLLLYCFQSFYVLSAINFSKDNLFSGFMLMFIILIFKGVDDEKNFESSKFLIKMMLTMLVIILFRMDGIYKVALPFIFYIVVNKKYWKRLIVVLVIPVMIGYSFNNIIVPRYIYKQAANPNGYLSKYTFMFQQIARVVSIHGTDAFENNDVVKLKKVLLRYDYLPDEYNPVEADPVIWHLNQEMTKKDFSEFMKVWLKYFPKYGTDYIQATLNNTYGYFYNQNNPLGYTTLKTERFAKYGNFKIYRVAEFEDGRNTLISIQNMIKKIPVIGMFYSVGFHVLIMLTIAIHALYKKNYKYLSLILPGIVTLLVCMASPVNGHFRYSLPIIFSTPFLLTIFFYFGQSKNMKKVK